MIDLCLQDIVHLLPVEGEVSDLHIAVECLRFEGHGGRLRVLALVREALAVNDLLGPDLVIPICLQVWAELALPLVNLDFTLESDAIGRREFQKFVLRGLCETQPPLGKDEPIFILF